MMNTAPQIQTAQDYLKESPWLQDKKVSTLLTSVLAGRINFNTLEKELFTIARNYLMQMLRAVLEHLDQLILHSAQREGVDSQINPITILTLNWVSPVQKKAKFAN
ncbi:MAG: hypothetical protein K6U04_13170 [Armatimonadetes bacterium]|nr:hypothetical protein [Armatimonadota bacterium]